jgi:hypothetical protein
METRKLKLTKENFKIFFCCKFIISWLEEKARKRNLGLSVMLTLIINFFYQKNTSFAKDQG